MEALQSAEALMIARALDPSQLAVLLQILTSDPIDVGRENIIVVAGHGEGVVVRMRGLALHLLHLLRRNRLLGQLVKAKCHALIELQVELESPLVGGLPSRKLKRKIWDTLVEMIEIASHGSGKERVSTVRQRIIQMAIQALTHKCLSMSLKTLKDFRIKERTAFVREFVGQQSEAYAKLVTPSMMARDIIPVVTQNLKDLDHYIKIRQPKRRRKKGESDAEKGELQACAMANAEPSA